MAMKENEKIEEAVKHYNELTGEDEVKRLTEVRLMAQLEENSALASARDKGTQIGMRKGLEEGKKQASIEMAKKLIKMEMSIEQIKEITQLKEEEIQNIKNK